MPIFGKTISTIGTILRNIAYLSDLLPLILYIFFCKSRKNIGLRVVFFLSIYFIFFNFFVLSNQQVRELYYYIFISISTFVEFAAISLLFYKVIGYSNPQKVIGVIAVLAGIYLLYSIFTSPRNSFNSEVVGLTYFLFLIYSIYYLFERMREPATIYLFSSPVFWIIVAIIIYSAGMFFPFLYAKNYMEEKEFLDLYDLIHDPLYIVRSVFFSLAMLTNDKQSQLKYPKQKPKTRTSFNPR
ncbi:MAG: hypothetical protein KF746_15395 [Chitinophagaceae bacterium]|nr:hypothetical protein [Chitinophagaceae bacterium]